MTIVSGTSPGTATRASVYQTLSASAAGRQTQLAARWASNASLIAGLRANGTQLQTYNANGMLSMLPPAPGRYKPVAAPTASVPAPATPANPTHSGADVAGNWVKLLQARPSMAFTATTYLLNQGIVANL